MQKKIISVLLATFMLATCLLSLTACGLRGEATTEAHTGSINLNQRVGKIDTYYGDVDLDGSVTMKDVLLVRKDVAGIGEKVDTEAGDVDGDSSISMKDVLLIRKYVAKMITRFPVQDMVVTTTTEATTTEATTTTTEATTAATTTTCISEEDPTINFIKGTDQTLGVWWWNSPTESMETAYLDLLEKNQFTEIYYYSYARMWTARDRADVHTFVQKALARGMRVSILYDDVNVTNHSSFYAWEQTVSGFLAYREEYPEDTSFYGIHCDVEPKATALSGYVNNFIPAVAAARKQGITVEVDLNCGWESYGRELTYGGITGVYQIIAANVDTMCLMAYQDTATAIFGKSYYPLAAAKAAGTKVVFGVEFDNSGEGDKVDFSGESKYEAYTQLYLLSLRLANQELTIPYGYAVHHIKAYYGLRDLPAAA